MKYINEFLRIIIALLLLNLAPISLMAGDNDSFSTIRDEETESYLREISYPIFKAAGLVPQNIRIHIVDSPVLNAFVAGGQHMYIHTGLITFSDDPSTLIGVIAHETGHLAGGHLARKAEEMKNASFGTALGYILGIASMAAGAPPAAMQALGGAGQQIAQRKFLKYSRTHEESADQASIEYLSKVKISPRGLMELMEKLNTDQMLINDDINPYRLTHPLSAARIAFFKNKLSPTTDIPSPKKLIAKHRRIVAKLRGFLSDKTDEILADYKSDDIPSRYARAVAYYRIPELKKAVSEIDSLIKDFPDDPYFYELKGQMLFENGYVNDSIISYKKAHAILSDSILLRLEIAVAQLAGESDKLIESAVNNLGYVVRKEPKNPFAWHQLAIAQGKSGELGLSYLSLAEEAIIVGKKDNVKKYVELSKKYLPENSTAMLRAKDIMEFINE